MICALIAKKKFYASAMMSAILMLHVALASISPFKLFDTMSGRGVDSYYRAMDVSSQNGLAPRQTHDDRASESERTAEASPCGALVYRAEASPRGDWLPRRAQSSRAEQPPSIASDMVARK